MNSDLCYAELENVSFTLEAMRLAFKLVYRETDTVTEQFYDLPPIHRGGQHKWNGCSDTVGFGTNQDVVVGQLANPVAITLRNLSMSGKHRDQVSTFNIDTP